MEQSHAYKAYDLHSHSTASDGDLTPGALVDAAYAAGVRCLALTDHDTLSGLVEARQAASRYQDMVFIDGIELTCQWQGRVVHLLGLGIDPAAAAFEQYLDNLTRLRQERAVRIAEKLTKKGLPDLLPAAMQVAGAGQVGRPHFAQAMVEAGLVSDRNKAFELYLGQGKVGDVKASWPELEEAVSLVLGAGGQAIVAHPTKYNFTFTRIRALMARLKELGGAGFEVSYPGVTPNHLRDLLRLADLQDYWVSAGSDFHSPEQRWTRLGHFPAFKAGRHILERLLQSKQAVSAG